MPLRRATFLRSGACSPVAGVIPRGVQARPHAGDAKLAEPVPLPGVEEVGVEADHGWVKLVVGTIDHPNSGPTSPLSVEYTRKALVHPPLTTSST